MSLKEKEENIINYIDNMRDEITSFVCNLIKIPSVNPPGNEAQIAKVIQEKTKALGLGEGDIIAKVPERPNIILSLKGRRDGKKIFFSGHLDTKPVGDRREWETDPFKPEIIDGKLYGLGSSDMKGAVVALVYALAALKEHANIEKGEISLVLTADEEGGSKFGAAYLSEVYPLKADIGLVAEPAGVISPWENIYIVARRALRFKTTIQGTQIHSSLTDLIPCVNANEKMCQVILKMIKDMAIKAPQHNLYSQGITKNIAVQQTGGVWYGVNAGFAEFRSELRLPPMVSAVDVYTQVQDFIDLLKKDDPTLKIEICQEIPVADNYSVEVHEDEPFLEVLKDVSKSVLGFIPPLGGFPGGTDAAAFERGMGIPTIAAFGPGILSVCHQPNEFIYVEEIIKATKIYALSALKYLNES